MTAAADVLRLARPSVSEQIANLEGELGVALFVRAGRRLELTEAGRLLRPEAERTLAAAGDASDVVRRAPTLTGGTASLGTFSTAHHLLLPELVEDFASRHPQVAIRLLGENSSQLADAVRAGHLEAGLVALPIEDDGLEVGAAVASLEVVYASTDHDRVEGPKTIEQLAQAVLVLPEARWGDEDSTRRQLAERAQGAGVAIRPRRRRVGRGQPRGSAAGLVRAADAAAYWFPERDVQTKLLSPSGDGAQPGMVAHDVRAGEEVLKGAAQLFRDPPAPLAELRDYWSFSWDGRVAWFEEALEVRVHACNPTTRVDVL